MNETAKHTKCLRVISPLCVLGDACYRFRKFFFHLIQTKEMAKITLFLSFLARRRRRKFLTPLNLKPAPLSRMFSPTGCFSPPKEFWPGRGGKTRSKYFKPPAWVQCVHKQSGSLRSRRLARRKSFASGLVASSNEDGRDSRDEGG